MDLRMPDGTLITGVPDNVNKADVIKRYQAYNAPKIADDGRTPEPFSDEGPIGLPALNQAKMQEDKLSPLQELLNIGKRGASQINQTIAGAGYNLGAYDPASYAERMRINQREYQAAAPSQGIQEGMARLQQASSTGSFTDVLSEMAHPQNYPAVASLVAESAISSAPIIPMSVIGGVLGGPVGTAVATGLGSFGMEFGSAVGDLLDKKNIDSSDPVAVRRALDDPKFLEEARDRAVKRGIPVAAFDALSAGFAGKFIGSFERALANNTIKGTVTKAATIAAAKEAGLQVGAGMAGEKIAQAVTGENKPLDVIMEGLAELPGGIGEVATNVRAGRARDQENVPAAPAQPSPVAPVAPPPVEPTAPPTPPAAPTSPVAPIAPVAPVALVEPPEDENAPSQDMNAMLEEMGLAPIKPVAAQQVEPRVEAAPSESQNTQAMLDELTGEAPAKEPKAKPLIERIGLPKGPARPNAKNDEISFDDAILLQKMMVKTVEDGLTTGKNRQQIVDQLVNLTKDGITPADFSRINDYMTERGVQEEPKPAPLLPKVEETKVEKTPKLPPKVEQVASFPMGENTEYHVLKTPTGYTANMFDKDAGKYVPGSAKMFPTKTFGDEAQTKAVDYVKEQAEKAAKFNPVEKPQEVVTPPEKTKTFPSHLSPEFQAAYENHLKSADAANKAKSMAKVGTATEAQAQPFIDRAEKARADMYEALFKERDNLSPENKETIDLAQRAIDVGQRGFAEGMLSNIIKNRPPTPQDMDFRRTRTAELETQAKPKENVPVKETHNLDTLFENQSLDKKRLDNLGTFDDRTKESIAKTNEYLQKLADAINAKGFRVFEGHASMPQDVKNLKDAFTNLHAGASRVLLDTQHVAGKEARKSKKSHGEQNVEIQAAQKKLNKSHIEQNKDIEKARDLLGEIKRKEPKSAFKRDELQGTPAPLPEEISAAEETVRLNKQDINKAKRASYSLWTALKGTLTAGNVADLGNEYRMLKAGKGKQGTDISSLVHSKALDPFLPFKMRTDSDTYDELDAVEEIKSRLMAKNYLTYEAEMEIEQLMGSTQDAEAQIREYLTLKEVNELIDQAADEQREADLDARTLESEREEGAIGAGENELALTGQTPEEVRAAERAKEDRLKADKEAEAKAKADEGVEDFTLTGSNRPADIAAAQGQESLFGESSEQKALAEVKKGLVRFASGMSGLSDLETGARARSGHLNYGVGVDVGLLSNNAIDSIANAVLNSRVPIFIDSGAFSNFRQNLKGNGPKPLDFNKILAKYDQITEAIQNQNEEERTDYPRPIIVMPDVVGDQAASLELIKQHKSWIIPEIKFNVTQPMIPIQKGELTLSQVYDELVNTLGTDDFIVGVPSQAEAVSKSELTEFLRESQPKKIHFLGAASDKKLTPLLNIVATESPDTKVTADASKVRSAILDGVAQGKTREQAIMDALMEEEDPGVLLDNFGPQLTDESNVIDGTDLVREIGKEKQLLLIADESNKLSANETAALEEEYGAKRGSNEFLERLHADVFNFITQGAKSIKNRIRPIINKIANSLLSVAIVLNPSFITKPNIIAVPQYETRTEAVYAEVPKEAKARMSPAAQQIYSVVYPAIKAELIENNKFFIVTDKPMARNFIFNPDGSLLMDKKVLLSKSMGDFLPAGSNDIDANKITPAGLYNLGLRDASRSKGEAETAGEYDYGKVFVIEHAGEGRHGPYSMTIMHSVWTHEKDAAQRLAALKTEAPNVSRYSFGCINVDKATFGDLVKNHLSQMDGAKLFIVPDSATNAMDFVNGKATYRDDMMRQRVEPITKEVKTPIKEARAVENEKMAAREEKFYNIVQFEPEFEEEKKRNPSFKRAVSGLNNYRNKGMLTDEEFALRVAEELEADNDRKSNVITPTRKRGILHIKARMNAEANRGTISKEAVDLAEWFMNQNPSLVDDLGISIKAKELGTGGFYSSMARVMTLMKYGGNEETPVHEILHHTERMMPTDIQNSIRKEWLQQLLKAQKNAKTPEEKIYFAALMNGHFDDNNSLNIVVKDKSGNVDKSVNKFLFDSIAAAEAFTGSRPNSMELAKFLLQNSDLPIENYRFMNPSEFWAVNGSRIVAGDYASVQGSILTKLKNWLGKLAEKIKSLFGFRSDAPIIRALESLSKSDGRFKTKDMLVAGEYKSINQIQGQMFPAAPAQQVGSNQGGGSPPVGRSQFYNYAGQPAPAATFDSPDDTKLDKFLRAIQDKHIDTKRLIQTIRATGAQVMNDFNAYLKEELYHGRTASRINDFLRFELLPLVKEMDKYKIDLPELDKYLHFRHAKERNAEIAKINPSLPDAGSGLKDAEVDTYFRTISPNRKKQLDLIANKVDAIIKGTQQALVDGGLEEQNTIDLWNKIYAHYVPLQRSEEELDFVNHGSGLGQGYGTKGKFSRPAYGSLKTVVDVFSNIALQRERAIIRSEKARVGKALYGLALQNPNPKFWLAVNPDAIKNKKKLYAELTALGLTPAEAANIIQEPRVATKDPLTGLVRYQVNPALRNSPNVFPVRINGKDRYIFFNNKDERANNIVKAMKNLDTEQLNTVFGVVGDFTRWIAAVNTQYNPVFGAWNFARDAGGAVFNLSTTPIANKKSKVIAGIFPAMFAIYGDLRAGRAGAKVVSPLAAWNDRFLKAGGATGYSEQFSRGRSKISGETLETVVEKELGKLNHGNVRQATQAVFDWLSDYNDAMENAVRLSAFKVAVESGMTDDDAASLAKNLTVNFNRKGSSSPTWQALFAFFNASVQGTARLAETLAGPAGKKIMAGGIALGVFQALALALAGYDDDEPPQYLKDKNLIIPGPGGKYAIIPMPLGLNVIPGMGRIATEYFLGKMGLITGAKGAGSKAIDMLGLLTDTFNPLGGGTLAQVITPTIADPIIAIATNKDAFGRPISKQDLSNRPTPGYTRSRENANVLAQGLSQFLNYASGGTKDVKGAISPTADQISYLAGQYTGGVGREITKAIDTGKALLTGEDLPSYKVPIVGKLYGETSSPSAVQDKFYKNVVIMSEHEDTIKGMAKRHEDSREYRADNPEAKLWQQANTIENQVSALNKQRKLLIERGAPQAVIDRNRETKTRLMNNFNEKVKSIQIPAQTANQ